MSALLAERELRHLLGTMPVDGVSQWPTMVSLLAQALEAPIALSYSYATVDDGPRPAFAQFSRPLRGLTAKHFLQTMVRRSWLSFDPLHVEVPHRNAVTQAADLVRSGAAPQNIRENLKLLSQQYFGLSLSEQLRAMVTDGATMLAWVGAAYEDERAVRPGARRRLKALLPIFKRRLLLEQRLAHEPLWSATLDATLEALIEPAFVVDGKGTPVLMNGAARVLWRDDRQGIRSSLRERSDARFERSTLDAPGLSSHALVVRKQTGGELQRRLDAATREWSLTAREAEVLGLVAEGRTNATIARALRCTARTIEVHLTHLMDKAHVNNRASLIARYWTGR